MTAYPLTLLSSSASSLGSWPNVLNASLICSKPAHVLPTLPREKATALPTTHGAPPPPCPRHPPRSPLSSLTGLRPQHSVPRVPIGTGHRETVLALMGLLFWGGRESRVTRLSRTPGPGPVRFLRGGFWVSVLTAPLQRPPFPPRALPA